MSELQTEPETEHETDAEPTPGPWEVYDSVLLPKVRPRGKGWDVAKINVPDGHMSTPVDEIPPEVERTKEANARLIAAAGTAAQEAKEMGYDPVEAVEALPELIEATESRGPVSDALCALKQAADFIEDETDSKLGAGRLRRLADEAAESVGLEIKVVSDSAEGSEE